MRKAHKVPNTNMKASVSAFMRQNTSEPWNPRLLELLEVQHTELTVTTSWGQTRTFMDKLFSISTDIRQLCWHSDMVCS